MKVLKVSNITYTYQNQKTASLRNVSFSIEKASYTAIVGLNGSGKSTLAKILARHIAPDAGSVTYEPNTKCSLVFQSPEEQIVCNLVSNDTAIALQNKNLDSSEVELRTIESLMITGLLHKASSASLELSFAQVQKEALAGIIALQPDVLILDDSLAMLDPTSRQDIFRFLAYWVHKGNTVIHITHDINAIKQANNVLMLEKGRLVFEGSVKSFFAKKNLLEKIKGRKISKNKRNKKQNSNISFSMKNISFSYKDESTLSNIDFSLQEGSLTSLTGISGSGKTTILELASGLLQADTGTVFANERPVLCQQNCNDCISEEFVCDDVALSIRANYTNEERAKKVKKAMDMVGLPFSQFAERKTSSLSHGQRRLLSIANAIVSDSSILLFDEPTAGLDGIERERILFLLASLAESGKTVLFTTHSKEEADFSEREITMIDGAIINDTVNVFRFPKRSEKIQVLNLAKSQNQKKLNVCKENKGIAFTNWLRKISLNLTGQRKNESLIARLPSITKIILFFALLVFIFASSTWPFCVCAFAFALLYAGLSRYFFSHLIKSFFISIPFVLFRFIFQLLFQTVEVGENILWSCNFLSISQVSITVLLCTLLKTWSFVACILSFVYTSSEYDIIKGLRILLKPLSILRFQVSFIIVIAQLIFKFVFFLADESYSIIKNQLIRGKLLYAKGTFKRLKIYLSLLPTILCSTLRRAENFVCALSERCFYE